MSRGRKPAPSTPSQSQQLVHATPSEQALVEAESNKRVIALAKQLNYAGALTTEVFEDNIHHGMRRTVEGTLEVGINLLLLKESSGHGYFLERLQALHMAPRAAQKFMSAALKFSNAPLTAHSVGNETKLIELLALDDEEIEALETDGAVGDITLDKIERMSASELRNEIKKLQGRVEDQDGRIEKLTKDNEKQAQRADKAARVWRAAKPDDQRQTLEQAVQQAANAVRDAIGMGEEPTGLSGAVHALAEHASQNGYDPAAFLGDIFARLLVDVQVARDDEQLPVAIPIHEIKADDWRDAH